MQKSFLLFLEDQFKPLSEHKTEQHIEIVESTLKKLSLFPIHPIAPAVLDKTKAHFSDIVKDATGTKYFIKIKLFNHPLMNNFFYKNKILGEILNKYKNTIALSAYTPPLISSSTEYVLYSFTQGFNVGSRHFHDIVKCNTNDLKEICHITQLLRLFPISLLPDNFEHIGWDHVLFFLYTLTRFNADKKRYQDYYSDSTLTLIENLQYNKKLKQLVEHNIKSLCHSDYKPGNFLKTKRGMILIDWDFCAVGNPYIDISQFQRHLRNKPHLQQQFLDVFEKQTITSDDKTLFTLWLFIQTFSESKYLIDRISTSYYARRIRFNPKEVLNRLIDKSNTYLQLLTTQLSSD